MENTKTQENEKKPDYQIEVDILTKATLKKVKDKACSICKQGFKFK